MTIRICLIVGIVICFVCRDVKAQQVFFSNLEEEGQNVVYEKETYFKGAWHTNGFTLGFAKGDVLSYDKAKYLIGEFSILEHPKESRQSPEPFIGFSNDFRPFKFGKTNHLYVLRGGIGNKNYFSVKARERNVRVGFTYEYGLNLGLLRPYYVRVLDADDPSQTRNITYSGQGLDDPFLNERRIIGGTGLSHGWNEIKLRPGIHLETAMVFDFGQNEARINSLQLGIMADVFAKNIELIALEPEQFLFINFYAAVLLGGRK